MEDRLRRLEMLGASVLEQNRHLTEQNRQLAEQNQELARQLQVVNQRHDELANRLDLVTTPPIPSPSAPPPVESESPLPTFNLAPEWPVRQEPPHAQGSDGSRFLVGEYDREAGQFVLVKPRDPEQTPFELNFDLITELRYTGFSRSADTWTNSAGTVLPIRNFNTIEVNRNWFQFTGYALDPRLHFSTAVFSSSTTNSTVFLGYLDYHFSKQFILSAGYYKLPGSREWLASFRHSLGADRTMATTFFRPNMTPGIWASGEPIENLHYIAMVANTFNGLNLTQNRIGSNMAFGGSLWWEPFGKYGPGTSDIEWHEEFTPRIGTSLAVSREHLTDAAVVQSNPEDTLFRLSDGTPLATIGALSPGVEVNATNVRLWALDAAIKYRGLNLSGEYYLRWLDDFSSTGGPLTTQSVFTHGAYAQTSYFMIPRRLEGYARYSFVSGQFGEGDEWSGGLNWYVLANRNWRMTFDATRINHSSAQNELTGYRAGESGTLFQVQMLTDF
ncbi:porin [Singulisphaera sp. Ch08]|uniref:Porin n=1 Tax=Singulisphaera sp. Ch08 TaxID=3120278 RepID=A0AAU7C8V1_9BACT